MLPASAVIQNSDQIFLFQPSVICFIRTHKSFISREHRESSFNMTRGDDDIEGVRREALKICILQNQQEEVGGGEVGLLKN